MTIKPCIICGKDFAPLVGNQLKCPLCKTKKVKKAVPHTVECIVCHRTFSTLVYNKKFCGKKCREAFHYTAVETTHTCLCCGKKFLTTKGNRKYCSDYCSLQAKTGKLKYREITIDDIRG